MYDKTFEGLLSVVFDAYTLKVFPELLLGFDDIKPLMATETHHVATDADKAQRVYTALGKKLSAEAMQNITCLWLADTQTSDVLLFRFICKIFNNTKLIEVDFSDPDILEAVKLAKKVTAEQHLLKGFVRFQKTLENIYFAVISPQYNTLPLIAPHFMDRFADQNWVIYDHKRGYGLYYDCKKLQEILIDKHALNDAGLKPELLAEGELFFQHLWKYYCTSISIKARENIILQKNLMPMRFWKYMPEMR